jgi:hypothetical protein
MNPPERHETTNGRDAPLLSVVAVSRNDDHGGDMRTRMQHFIDGFFDQCRRHRLDTELILVEWNPPLGRPPLDNAIEWPPDFATARVRMVTVPRSVHALYPLAAQLPLFQMIAKNVGIRRARGRFVLATNVDILFDDALVRYLRECLTPGTMLRVDRYDVSSDLPNGVPFAQVLSECSRRVLRVNARFATFDVRTREMVAVGVDFRSQCVAAYFETMMFGPWSGLRRLARFSAEALGHSAEAWGRSAKALGHSAKAWGHRALRLGRILSVFVRSLRRTAARLWTAGRRGGSLRALLNRIVRRGRKVVGRAVFDLRRIARAAARTWTGLARLPWSRIAATPWHALEKLLALILPRSAAGRRLRSLRWLHTNACGDFTLLAREDWSRLRGYPEWPIHSWHLDSAFMYAAAANGITEVALSGKYRIYHIEHASGWTPGGSRQLFAQLDARGIRYLSDEDLTCWRDLVTAHPQNAMVNGPDWGLADRDLVEREILPRVPRVARHALPTVQARA